MKRLILAGGGHAHLHVLKSLARRPWPQVEVLLVSPQLRQVYSGMLPGWIAGHYRLDECVAPLSPLAAAAGARLWQDSLVGIDAPGRRIHCASGRTLAYDALSLDTGAAFDLSTLAATSAPLLAVRPIERFILGWSRFREECLRRGAARIAVVGGGAAGVELALAMRYRLTRELPARAVTVMLVEGRGLLAGHGAAVIARVGARLQEQGVIVEPGHAAGAPGGVLFADGRHFAADLVVAATGATPPPWLAATPLARAEDGFVAVGAAQQSLSHEAVFAAGDIATRVDAALAKSGVYAVRAGPVLAENLLRYLQGRALRPHVPQATSLYLLATGPRHAIASWRGWSAQGHWVWRWKDWIDRRFMKQYLPSGAAVSAPWQGRSFPPGGQS